MALCKCKHSTPTHGDMHCKGFVALPPVPAAKARHALLRSSTNSDHQLLGNYPQQAPTLETRRLLAIYGSAASDVTEPLRVFFFAVGSVGYRIREWALESSRLAWMTSSRC